MATRAHTVLANLITAIEAITPDEQSGPRDKFRNIPGIDTAEGTLTKDRSFVLVPRTTSARSLDFIQSTHPSAAVIEFDLGVAYQKTRNITDRILKDSERLMDALEVFQNTYSGDVVEISISGGEFSPLDRSVVIEYALSVVYILNLS